MKKLKWICALFAAGCIFAAVGCKDSNEQSSSAVNSTYNLSLNAYTLTLDLFGGEEQLNATTLKDNVAVEGVVEWQSENPAVVVVENGKLKPTGVGETYITASWQDVQEKCLIVVKSDSVPVLQAECETLGFIYNVSDAYKLDAWVLYKNEEYRNQIDLTYEIPETGKEVAEVTAEGLVTPIGIGKTELIVKASFRGYQGIGMALSIPVTVSLDMEVQAMLIGNDPSDLYVQEVSYDGVTYPKTASLGFQVSQMESSGMTQVDGATVVWRTSDENVATVSNEGVITSVGAGDCTVWCEYNNNQYITASNLVQVSVKPYAVVKTLTDIEWLFSKDNTSSIPTKDEIFGQQYNGQIEEICLEEKNILDADSINIADYSDGLYLFDIVNTDGYAYQIRGAISSYSIEVEDVKFALLKGEKKGNVQHYNMLLPAKSAIYDLLSAGYKSLEIQYYCESANASASVNVSAKYASELRHKLSINQGTIFSFGLNVLLDRYDELDEFSRSEYAFKVDESNATFEVKDFNISTSMANEHTDAKIDRQTKIGDFSIVENVEKAGRIAQVSGVGTVTGDKNIFVNSEKAVSKETVAQWLNEGYDTLRVKYYLEFNTSRMTRTVYGYAYEPYAAALNSTYMGEKVALVANEWAVADFSLARFYALRSSNELFVFDGLVADDGSAMTYTLYIEEVTAEKASDSLYDIRMYAGYPVEMYVAGGSPKGVNEYGKEIDGKVANFYTYFDVQGKSPWNGAMNFFTAINVTVEQLQQMKAQGYISLSFEVYAKTSNGENLRLRMNPEGNSKGSELHQWTLTSGEWTTIEIELDILIQYYTRLNGCKGGYEFWYVMSNGVPTGLETVIYEVGVGSITPTGIK